MCEPTALSSKKAASFSWRRSSDQECQSPRPRSYPIGNTWRIVLDRPQQLAELLVSHGDKSASDH
jgi:hypothetical protein